MFDPDDSDIDEAFVMSKSFDAPRELVFRAWTDTGELKRWFGPAGMTMPTCSLDLRPGGGFHYCLRTPEGFEMWGKWTFVDIDPPHRLVLIQSFSDASGAVTRHPMSATWPLRTHSTTTFTENDGKTTITIRWAPYEATDVERETFAGAHAGMLQGWSGTFERLSSYLDKATEIPS